MPRLIPISQNMRIGSKSAAIGIRPTTSCSSASFWIQNAYNRSELVNFDEDSYPIILSGWYAPDDRWSFTGGYATFSNWIVQDVTLGRENGGGNEFPAFTARWQL